MRERFVWLGFCVIAGLSIAAFTTWAVLLLGAVEGVSPINQAAPHEAPCTRLSLIVMSNDGIGVKVGDITVRPEQPYMAGPYLMPFALVGQAEVRMMLRCYDPATYATEPMWPEDAPR